MTLVLANHDGHRQYCPGDSSVPENSNQLHVLYKVTQIKAWQSERVKVGFGFISVCFFFFLSHLCLCANLHAKLAGRQKTAKQERRRTQICSN